MNGRYRFDAVGRHQQRILLRGGCDDAFLYKLTSMPGSCSSTICDDRHPLLTACRLEGGVAPP